MSTFADLSREQQFYVDRVIDLGLNIKETEQYLVENPGPLAQGAH